MLPLLIATKYRSDRYEQALGIIAKHVARAVLPVWRFQLNAAAALIIAHFWKKDLAKGRAQAALNAAKVTHSGLRYHADIGLVKSQDQQLIAQLVKIADLDIPDLPSQVDASI